VQDKLSVLRECSRVLKPGGRMAGYLIHTPGGLGAAGLARAAELGPAAVGATPLPDLAAEVGLTLVTREDVTELYRATCAGIHSARALHEDSLRAEEGDEVYEEGQQRKAEMLEAIREGLLVRSLVVLAKP
jgi:hypothetical protein